MERIGFWKVAGKTWLLLRARAGIFLLYWLGLLAIKLICSFFFPSFNEVSASALVLALALLCAYAATGLSLSHFTVLSCRNKTSFFPARPVLACVKYALATLGVLLTGAPAAVLSLLIIFWVLASGILNSGQYALLGLFLFLTAAILGQVGLLVPVLRFGFVTIAISVNEDSGFKRAWRMTRGYTLKLLAAFLLCLLPQAIIEVIIVLFGWSSTHSPLSQLVETLTATTSVFFLAVFQSVLYLDFFPAPGEPVKETPETKGVQEQI